MTKQKSGFELNSVNFLKKNLIKNHNNSILLKNNLLNTTQPRGLFDMSHNCTNNFHNTSHYMSTCMFDKSWAFYNQFANTNALIAPTDTNPLSGDHQHSPIVAVTNPNKALVVINGRTTEILTANNISCELFGLSETKLIGTKLKDLFDFR